MSEPTPPPERRSGGGVKGMLTRKLGPLPMWVWVLIVTALILAWVVLKGRGSSSQTSGQQDTVGQGQVPQFVNITPVSVSPPPAADQDGDEDEDEKGKLPHEPPPVPVPHPKPPPRRPPPHEPPPHDRHGPPLGPPHIVHGKVPGFGHHPGRKHHMNPA